MQRWLKFVKYLPDHNYKPFVVTPKNPAFALKDPSLLADVPPEAEVIRYPIWEPYELANTISHLLGRRGRGEGPKGFVPGRTNLLENVLSWARGNLLIPDPRVFWVKPTLRALQPLLRTQGISTLITTGPPHSMHLIGLGLKRLNPSLKWLADFRDPWSQWGFLDSVRTSRPVRARHRQLEARVLQTADRVVTVTPFFQRQLSQLAGRHVDIITNGFDDEDFRHFIPATTKKFVVRHVGFVNERNDWYHFLTALDGLLAQHQRFADDLLLDFVGEVHPRVRGLVERSRRLASITSFTPTVPHSALQRLYSHSSVLLLILSGYKDAQGYLTGKIFEYLATGLPILGVGPIDGDAANLLRQTCAGVMIEPSDQAAMAEYLLAAFSRWRQGTEAKTKSPIVEKYSRKSLTAELAAILEEM